MSSSALALLVAVVAFASAAGTTAPALPSAEEAVEAATLERSLSRYAPVELKVDLAALPESERKAVAKLVEAARVVDALYLKQVWTGNEAIAKRLADDASPLGLLRRAAFERNAGPWDRLDGGRRVVAVDAPERKPAQAGFYPADATRDEVQAWIAALPPAEQQRALGLLTVVRRDKKAFKIVPYAVEYKAELAKAAKLLREASTATADPALKKFLDARAKALLDDDYQKSDALWVDLKGPLEPVVGPYEVAEDGWFTSKAAYQAFVAVVDVGATQRLAKLSARMRDLQAALPIDPKLKAPRAGRLPLLHVVDVVYAAGDADRGATPVAYQLPNDERVLAEKGGKRVVVENVIAAKYEAVLKPLAAKALAPAGAATLSYDAHLNHALLHELAHAIGPHHVRVAGRDRTVKEVVGGAYDAFEEAKAETVALWGQALLAEKATAPAKGVPGLHATWLASALRTVRFGVHGDHGRGVAVVLSTLIDRGAVTATPTGALLIDEKKAKAVVGALLVELYVVAAKGDAAAATKIVASRGALSAKAAPLVAKAIALVGDVPVDVAPTFVSSF